MSRDNRSESRVERDRLEDTFPVRILNCSLSRWQWLVKDAQDRAIALLVLAVISPLFLAIMIVIKSSSAGPVFFRQIRVGYCGKTFEIVKFRTMRVDYCQRASGVLKLTTRHDPRVFPFGRILRRMSLDELPQLLNVLKGDMWLVGPRPHSPLAKAGGKIYAEAIQEYAARHRIKPGITGWAQVCGWRGPTDTLDQLKRRVEHDLYYIENWSTSFDLRILMQTLPCTLRQKNAF
jgi:lipopolysaccharide/colanic/teichoic acid biosynthesis glycosyltransferase